METLAVLGLFLIDESFGLFIFLHLQERFLILCLRERGRRPREGVFFERETARDGGREEMCKSLKSWGSLYRQTS
jgi:hypothetical protein